MRHGENRKLLSSSNSRHGRRCLLALGDALLLLLLLLVRVITRPIGRDDRGGCRCRDDGEDLVVRLVVHGANWGRDRHDSSGVGTGNCRCIVDEAAGVSL